MGHDATHMQPSAAGLPLKRGGYALGLVQFAAKKVQKQTGLPFYLH
jgi:hypothetical protein